MSIKWPIKRKSIGPMGDDERDTLIWNAAIDACRKAVEEAQGKGLDEEALYDWFIKKGYEVYKSGWRELSKAICQNFASPQKKVLSVEKINHAIWKVDENVPLTYRMEVAQAIHKLLEEGKKKQYSCPHHTSDEPFGCAECAEGLGGAE